MVAVASGKCILEPFFLQCLRSSSLSVHNPVYIPAITQSLQFSAFRRRLRLALDTNALSNSSTSTSAFRHMIAATSSPSALIQLTCTRSVWDRFWRLSLSAMQRNVMFRLLHRLIPTCQLLHRLLADKYLSAFCLLCEFLWPGTTIDSVYAALTTLDFRGIRSQSGCRLPPNVLLIIALSEVWKAHWAHILRDLPFCSVAAFRATKAVVQRQYDEPVLADD
ncbi:hypothetical protein EDC96DRAFT_596509 [Choanephora cucurbitarum]|nr:hypothetical protein EDC96DRAFT_596509 [Choanephora cucurbitarum]